MLQLDIHCIIEDEVGVHGINCHHPLKQFDIHKNLMQARSELQNPNVYMNRISSNASACNPFYMTISSITDTYEISFS